MGKFVDLTGQKFNLLTVVERAHNAKCGKTQWLCKCECGNQVIVMGHDLKNGNTKSCGCYKNKIMSQGGGNLRHGMCQTRLYAIWNGMKTRCYNQEHHSYKDYGAKGIKMCNEWLSFEHFYQWAMTNGYSDNLTIERQNFEGNYEPSNCCWITLKEQANNRSSNHFITYNGKTQTVKQWAVEYNIGYQKLLYRINRLSWNIEKALNTP